MFSMCSELTSRAPIPVSRIAQFMQPWRGPQQTSPHGAVVFLSPHPLILKLKYCQIRMGWTEEMDIEGTRNLFERSVREVKRAKAIFMMYSLGQTTVSLRINLKPMMSKSWRKNDVKPYYFRLSWSGDMSHSYVSSTSRWFLHVEVCSCFSTC